MCSRAAVAAAPPAATTGEAATARYFASIRNDPSLLLAFLARDAEGRRSAQSPVGRDLRRELPALGRRRRPVRGDGDAVDRRRRRATRPPAGRRRPTWCANSTLFNQAIDAMSMRHWDPSLNGHDHFFATFGKFGADLVDRTGDMLAEVAARAAAEHVSYLELMLTPDGGVGAARGIAAGWDPDLRRGCATRCWPPASATRSSARPEPRLDEAEARRARAAEVRHAAGRPGLPRHRPLHLPGRARDAPASRCSARCSPASRSRPPIRASSA